MDVAFSHEVIKPDLNAMFVCMSQNYLEMGDGNKTICKDMLEDGALLVGNELK